MKNLLIAATVITMATGMQYAAADPVQESTLSYSAVSVSIIKLDMDIEGFDSEVSTTGTAISGSIQLSDHFFVSVFNYNSETDDEWYYYDFFGSTYADKIEMDQFGMTAGFFTPIAENTDFVATAGFYKAKVSWLGESISDTGKTVTVGVRSRVLPWLELNGGLAYSAIDGESNTALGLRANFFLSENIFIGVGVASSSDQDETALTFGYEF